ncbi:hypothetical protein ELI43_24375 [Rhizobium leguminosarum]|uniref:hypothetical protein n=1 Tax=Rhizobium leguminosarum TaxID=384 RepID=UPI00102F3CD2|nr:hypothetical protein [Rhizobium leguminosarum]TAU55738.1 hypothetical protein ELI43_24375 [Rhizobium leguminosarum]
MFDIGPLTTSNLLTIIQIIVVIIGFLFSWKSLKSTQTSIGVASNSLSTAVKSLDIATANAQAQLYNQMAMQGRDLQFRFMNEYHGAQTPADQKARQELLTGTIIGYYAACFGLRNILVLPTSVTKLLDDELKQLIRQPAFRKRFDEIQDNFSREFIKHVSEMRGV